MWNFVWWVKTRILVYLVWFDQEAPVLQKKIRNKFADLLDLGG